MNNKNTCFVYFIENTYTKHVKIGISDKPETRLKTLQTANSAKLKLAHTIELANTNHALNIEDMLHAKYADYRLEGEWFNISAKDAIDYVENILRLAKALPPKIEIVEKVIEKPVVKIIEDKKSILERNEILEHIIEIFPLDLFDKPLLIYILIIFLFVCMLILFIISSSWALIVINSPMFKLDFPSSVVLEYYFIGHKTFTLFKLVTLMGIPMPFMFGYGTLMTLIELIKATNNYITIHTQAYNFSYSMAKALYKTNEEYAKLKDK